MVQGLGILGVCKWFPGCRYPWNVVPQCSVAYNLAKVDIFLRFGIEGL